jgi:hypothetical protein
MAKRSGLAAMLFLSILTLGAQTPKSLKEVPSLRDAAGKDGLPDLRHLSLLRRR